LKNVSFEVKAGQTIALVGSTGAGKTTVVNLISRFYEVSEGAVLIDGHNLNNVMLETLRGQIGLMPQDTFLFSTTIKENIRYGKLDATEEEMINACREANIHSFIESLPDGYDTAVGNRGMKLSGGQKQRISIARVLLRKPVIIVFDEATSALDSLSEKLIQDAIGPLLKKSASIVIAHRLSTIMAADEILVMDQGEIVERGSHESLMEEDCVYHELYRTQFEGAFKMVEGL